MVYESDFYTTRRPYRPSPSVSSYTVSRYLPSRQIRILPGIGRVHVVHSYDRLIPYIGHKRLTIVSAPPHVIRIRPSIYIREIDRIQHKARPYHYYSPTSSYLNSEPITFFDDETRLIRAQAQSLVRKIHAPLPRIRLSWPLYPKTRTFNARNYLWNFKITYRYHYEQPLTAKIISDDYVYRMLSPIQSVKSDIYRISHYVTDPIRKHLGPSHLACVRYGGDRAYSRRRNLTLREIYAMQSDTVRNDIQLLSYYINANKDRKALYEGTAKASTANLNAQRISRVWSKPQMMLEPSDEIKELREQRAERFRKIQEVEAKPEVETKIKRSTKKEEERALAEEQAKKQQAAKKEEETRRAELARQEALAAQAAAERQAEIERKAELVRQEELNKKAEAERLASEKAEKARLETEKAQAEKARVEEEKRAAEATRQEEERQQLLRLEELARQAEEEKEKELARQAEELAELARQEAELAELARKEAELAELAKQEQESAELDRQEAEGGEEELEPEEQVVEEAEVAGAESNIPAEATEEAVDEDTAEPVVEEPETPEATESAPVAEAVEVDEEEEGEE